MAGHYFMSRRQHPTRLAPLRRRPPRWVFAPRQRWQLIGALPAGEVAARLEASPRFAGSVGADGLVGLVWGGPLLPVGPELRGNVTGRTNGSILTLEARMATPVAIATTVWVAAAVAAAVALTGLIAFAAVLLLCGGVFGALLVGVTFQLAARRCRVELLQLLEAELVDERPATRRRTAA